MINERLNGILTSADLPIVRRVGHTEMWEQAFHELPYRPVAYSNASLDYQHAYQCGHGGEWRDLSLIVCWNNKPAAIWPISFSTKNGESRLTSQGAPVMPPLFVPGCPSVTRKRIIKGCLAMANAIAAFARQDTWESGESFSASLGMSDWHVESMGRGAACSVRHELYLDLLPDLADIKREFRKSYKALIASGSRLWSVNVLESGGEGVWDRFRNLHLQVSGRVTRSDETWTLQHELIKQGNAFLVWLEGASGEMVGGGFFSCTASEGLYAVGAYERSLFDKPLGHVVQYRAIEEFKKRGISWYKIGARPYATDSPPPTAKEISIAEFKQGFASHVFPHYSLTHEVADDEDR